MFLLWILDTFSKAMQDLPNHPHPTLTLSGCFDYIRGPKGQTIYNSKPHPTFFLLLLYSFCESIFTYQVNDIPLDYKPRWENIIGQEINYKWKMVF